MKKLVESYLKLASKDLKASRLLVGEHRRAAAFWAEQAAEKLLKAVLATEDVPFQPYDVRIGRMADALTAGHRWRDAFISFDHLSKYGDLDSEVAEDGSVREPPSLDVMMESLARLEPMVDEVATWCREQDVAPRYP